MIGQTDRDTTSTLYFALTSKRLNQSSFFCETSHDPRKGLWIIKFKKAWLLYVYKDKVRKNQKTVEYKED